MNSPQSRAGEDTYVQDGVLKTIEGKNIVYYIMMEQKQTANQLNEANNEQFAVNLSIINLYLIAIALILVKIIVFYLAYLYGMHQSDLKLKEIADQKLLKPKEEIRSGNRMTMKKNKKKMKKMKKQRPKLHSTNPCRPHT